MEIKRISLSKVLKLELPELINDVYRIIKKHDDGNTYFRVALKTLKEQQDIVKQLEVPRKAHPLTKKIELLREKELQFVGAIVSHMGFIERADIESMRSAITIASPVVKRFLSGLRKNNESVINQIIKQFLQHLDKYPEVYEALSNLGLQPFVDELRKVNADELNLMSLRDTKPRSKINSRLIQKNVQGKLRFVIDAMIVLNAFDDKSNYEPFVRELNQLLTRYITLINTRKTHNKRRAKQKQEKQTDYQTSKQTDQNNTPLTVQPNLIETLRLGSLNET